MNWQEIKGLIGTGWFIAPVVFVVWMVLGLLAKSILFRKMRKLAGKTETKVDDVIIHTLSLPLTILIIFVGLAISEKILTH